MAPFYYRGLNIMSYNKKLIKQLVCLFMFTFGNSSFALAEGSYKNTFYVDRKSSDSLSTQSTTYSSGLTMYFSPVVYGNYPYAEASFVDRQSFVQFYAGQNTVESPLATFDGDVYSAGGKFSSNTFPLSFAYSLRKSTQKGNIDASGPVALKSETNTQNISLDFHISKLSSIEASYASSNQDRKANGNSYFSGTESNYEISFKHLSLLGENKYFSLTIQSGIRLSAQNSNSGDIEFDSKRWSVHGNYYFNKSFSVSLDHNRYTINSIEQTNGALTSMGMLHYFNPMTNVSFSLSESSSDSGSDSSSFYVRVSHSF